MLHIRTDHLVFKWPGTVLVAFALVSMTSVLSGVATKAQGHTTRAAVAGANPADQSKGEDEPIFNEYKGVRIGMTSDETRKKLGEPQDKSDEQDFFVFNEKESAQVFYDKSHKTYAVSVNYLGVGNTTPLPKAVLGTEIVAKPDGSMYKLTRYPKAGYWVSYSRTAGNDPLVTVTMQKID